MRKVDPFCIRDRTQCYGVTNKGYLIPCVYYDSPQVYADPEAGKLMSVAKISDYEKISDIPKQPLWVEFFENLEKGIGPRFCQRNCGVIEEEYISIIDTHHPQAEIIYHPDGHIYERK